MNISNKLLSIVCLLLLVFSGVNAQTFIPANDQNISYIGRVSFANATVHRDERCHEDEAEQRMVRD